MVLFVFGLTWSPGLVVTGTVASTKSKEKRMMEQPVAKKDTVDYASRIPKYTFADTLEEQEAQLKANPLILRFAESRRRLTEKDRFRTVYHFTSPESFNGDPNGLSFWQGRWHLFYQAWPVGDHRQHWGHAVSEDLIHWRDLPYAIYPDPEKSCFSGSALVEEDRVIACYHGWFEIGNMIAVSNDPCC